MLLWLLVASFWGFTRAIQFTKWRPWKFLVVTRIFLLQLLKRFSFIFSRLSSCYYVMHCHVSILMTLLCRSRIVSHLLSTNFYVAEERRVSLCEFIEVSGVNPWSLLLVQFRFDFKVSWSFWATFQLSMKVQFLYCLCIQCPCLAFDSGGGFKRSHKGPRLLLSEVLIWRLVWG